MVKSNYTMYWLLSILISALFICAIGYKWFQVKRIHGKHINVVRSESELENLFATRETIEFKSAQQPYRIPTGFFIRSLAFITPSDINITGYIWQKYPESFPKEFKKGFVFAEEVNSTRSKLDIVYEFAGEQDGKKYQMTGWYFDVNLRQSFDYSKYPLDFLTVWIRLWPKDFINDIYVILVPDFKSYSSTNKKTYGLDLGIAPSEWSIDETFFSYNNMPYDTDFGLLTKVKEVYYKEFYINLGIRRKFINSFVINLVPLLVVAILLFAQTMIVTGEKDLREKFGFTTNSSIATCAALFFVVMLAHVQVRTLFAGSGLVYIEYFYLIMYIVILITALNAYLFSLGKREHFNLIFYRDNLISEVAYWPILLGMMALVTWIKL